MDTLQKYKERPLYEVPEQFFEQFQQDVMQRIMKEEKQQKTYRRWISAVGMAASISLILTLSYFLFLNRDANEPFYVHQEIALPEESVVNLDSNFFAEVVESSIEVSVDSAETPELISPKAPSVEVAADETIVYRAVDFYIDDYETNNFCEAMYDLECYYDY